METQSDWELQAWQKEILENFNTHGNIFGEEERFELLPQQRKMIEKLLSHGYYISGEERNKETLEMVLALGFYFERDKKILNYARKCYLEGKNWIK